MATHRYLSINSEVRGSCRPPIAGAQWRLASHLSHIRHTFGRGSWSHESSPKNQEPVCSITALLDQKSTRRLALHGNWHRAIRRFQPWGAGKQPLSLWPSRLIVVQADMPSSAGTWSLKRMPNCRLESRRCRCPSPLAQLPGVVSCWKTT